MSTLLRIDASANPGRSASRALTGDFATAWQAARPVSAVLHRDIGLNPPAALDTALLGALWAGPDKDLDASARAARTASNLLVDEFLAADAFVFGVPMYNFSVPAGFKAWIDHVARFGKTLVRGPQGAEPVLQGRRALVVSTRAGDFSPGGPREGWDFTIPYLEKVLGYLGLETDFVTVVQSPGRPGDAERLAEAREQALDVLARWIAAEKGAAAASDPTELEAA